jgi:release factor glutamine methyltransferase
MSSGAYLASEDSAALREALASHSGETCLEIGAGNGGNLKELCRRFGLVVGTDLVRPVARDWSSAGADYVIADGASCFRGRVFDLVAFNPPYVPSERIVDRAVDGGRDGVEVSLRFLRDALGAVKREGRILFLLSSDNPSDEFETECARRGFSMKSTSSKRLFYETLRIYEVSSRTDRSLIAESGR